LAETYKLVCKLTAYPQFPATLKLLYASTICYAIAIALYQYFCPRIIKLYETELDYVNSAYPVYLRAHPDKKVQIVLANLLQSQSDIKDQIEALKRELDDSLSGTNDELQQKLDSIVKAKYPSCVQRYLLTEYERATKKHPAVIWTAGLLYSAGTLLLLYLLFQKSLIVFIV
jgi:hypothetical protein